MTLGILTLNINKQLKCTVHDDTHYNDKHITLRSKMSLMTQHEALCITIFHIIALKMNTQNHTLHNDTPPKAQYNCIQYNK
jgi:hypothetical protein